MANYNVDPKDINSNNWGNPVATITPSDGKWSYLDENASLTTVYHYRVTPVSGNTETAVGADETCRGTAAARCYSDGNPNTNDANYRMYYRLVECPSYDGKSACTENVDVNGKEHVAGVLQTSESYRSKIMGYGFNDPPFQWSEPPLILTFSPATMAAPTVTASNIVLIGLPIMTTIPTQPPDGTMNILSSAMRFSTKCRARTAVPSPTCSYVDH